MMKRVTTNCQKLLTYLLLIPVACIFWVFPEIASSDNPRIIIGINLFPSFLASDQNISTKTGNDDHLHILILYQYDKKTADNIAQRLIKLKKIRGIPIHVIVTSIDELEYSSNQSIAGMFISEPMIQLTPIIKKSIDHQFIVFSPFEGDVEKGITGGIYITEKIEPYINQNTLLLANIKMKSFFMKVSKKYDE
jgi:hypothetical protein